jgi:hypothetical protein
MSIRDEVEFFIGMAEARRTAANECAEERAAAKSTPAYKPGQTVWLVLSDNRHTCRPARITRVGRKWATLDDGNRFDVTNGLLDGRNYSSPGRVWLSSEAHAQHVELVKSWRQLNSATDAYAPPAGLTLERIAQARELLGLGAP